MNANAIRQESPLVQFMASKGAKAQAADAGVVLRERPFLGHINLRGDAGKNGQTAWGKAVKAILGATLPCEPNTVAEAGDIVVCWLGPDEWLVICPAEQTEELHAALAALREEHHTAATVLSGGQTVIVLSGDKVRDMFAKGSTLDFHPRAFKAGDCAQSTLGKAPALYRLCEDGSFELVIRRSFADYIGLWLADAAHEFGLRVEA